MDPDNDYAKLKIEGDRKEKQRKRMKRGTRDLGFQRSAADFGS